MKRTRSPSPSISHSRRRLNGEANDIGTASSKASLSHVQLHPLLNESVVTAPNASAAAAVTANPFLAHWEAAKDGGVKGKGRNLRIPHIDKNLAVEPSAHRPRPLKFNAPGKFIAKAEAERTAAQIRQLEREIAEATEDFAADLDVSLIADILRNESNNSNNDNTNDNTNDNVNFEWWDVPFLQGNTSSSGSSSAININYDLLGNLIQRPRLDSLSSPAENTIKMYLTPEEGKKLRRQRRLEAQKDLAEKIALGLLPAPEPKIKLSSLPRMLAQPGNALGDESVHDPTRIASEIRAQSQARQAAHQAGNEQRKLGHDERAAKNFRKYAELDSSQIHAAVFKLNDRLEDPGRRFKVLINAQQNHLQGRAITTPNFTLIIVQGGPKGIKRYTHLILNRIEPNLPNWAQLLWSSGGNHLDQSISPAFTTTLSTPSTTTTAKPFQFKIFDKNFDALQYLEKLELAHFWSLAAFNDEDK